MRPLLRRLRYVFRHRQWEDELAEEMAFHQAMMQREFEGCRDPIDAERATRRVLGSLALAGDQARDVWMPQWLHDLARDLRFALRLVSRERAFTMAAVTVLGLGIGVTNLQAVLIDASCVRGLPISGVDRVLFLGARDARQRDVPLSFREVERLEAGLQGASPVGAFTSAPVVLGDEGRAPDRALATYVSAALFGVLRERPLLGRDFESGDDRDGASSVVMLTAGVWHARYGGDPAIVGHSIRVNGVATTVIGVMPTGFRFPAVTDVWLPLSTMGGAAGDRTTVRTLNAITRMAGDTTLVAVRTNLGAETQHLSRLYPATNAGITLTAVPINERYTGRLTDSVWLTFAGVAAVVLLLACANAANLLLMRAVRRGHEMAVRASLGASRPRLVRQLLVESAVLAALSGAVGGLLSVLALRAMKGLVPANTLPYWMAWSMDRRAFGILCTIGVVTVFVFGLAPALHVVRTDVHREIKEGGRAASSSVRARRWTTVLLTIECGLTMILAAALVAGLRSTQDAARQFVVVNPDRVMTTWVTLAGDRYGSAEARRNFYHELVERTRATGGVSAASVATTLPLGGGALRTVEMVGGAGTPVDTPPTAWTITIGPRYFEVLGLPLLRGRPFEDRDGSTGHETAIVNQRFVDAFFPKQDAIGRRIWLGAPNAPTDKTAPLTIVATVPTVRQRTATADPDPIVYLPLGASPPRSAALLVRGISDLAAMGPGLRDTVRALDPELPLYRTMPLAQALAESQWNGHVSKLLVSGIGAVAVCLVAIGLYAVLAHAVAQRTREIGVRMALGARRVDVVVLVARRAAVHLGWGLGAGIACTLAFDRLVRLGAGASAQDHRMTDPLTLAAVVGLLTVITAAASIAPGWAAARVDPLLTLRDE